MLALSSSPRDNVPSASKALLHLHGKSILVLASITSVTLGARADTGISVAVTSARADNLLVVTSLVSNDLSRGLVGNSTVVPRVVRVVPQLTRTEGRLNSKRRNVAANTDKGNKESTSRVSARGSSSITNRVDLDTLKSTGKHIPQSRLKDSCSCQRPRGKGSLVRRCNIPVSRCRDVKGDIDVISTIKRISVTKTISSSRRI